MLSRNIIRYSRKKTKNKKQNPIKKRFKKNQSSNKQQSIKRSLSSRSLCSILHFQSPKKGSVLVHHSTRSLPYVRCYYFYFFSSLVAPLCYALDKVKKQTVAHFLAVAQPPAINLNRNARKGLMCLFCYAIASLLRLPLHAPVPTLSLRKNFASFPVQGGCQ